MRLKSIKLAGFKSFVDPTKVPLPSNLIAIVGPNGCGKSNIIDAIRWVMGETSAKHLRGDSMTDVIFNGSSARKPVGQAQVELIFDNSDATLGGEYAKYSEISIKRQVTRDAQSTYFLNNTRCRRRDITGIFQGTGLGSRSYSIIAQDTISRLIEAKPEDLRVYLEEAAGISKYKERRRETENRIRHTRENLERLTDIRDELQKQLERLDRQAKAAAKYKEFREEERRYKSQLLALKWQAVQKEFEEYSHKIKTQEVKFEALNADITNLSSEHTTQRELLHSLNESFESVQTHYYQVGAEIARMEEAIQHQKSRRQQLTDDLQQVDARLQTAKSHAQDDQQNYDRIKAESTTLQPQVETINESLSENESTLKEHEHQYSSWQEEWESFNRTLADTSKQIDVEQTRITQFNQNLSALIEREQKLIHEQESHSEQEHHQILATLSEEVQQIDSEKQTLIGSLENEQQQLQLYRDKNRELNQQLDQLRRQFQEQHGRRASLEALQETALGKGEGEVSEWLTDNHLQEAKRFAELIEVDAGWESAVELAIGHLLQAVCVDNLKDLKPMLANFPTANMTFIQSTTSQMTSATLKSLADVVKVPAGYENLLNTIFIADTLDIAMEQLPQLQSHQSIITRDGLLLTPQSLTIINEQDATAGVIKRQKDLQELDERLQNQEQEIRALEATLNETSAKIESAESNIQTIQETLTQLSKRHSEANSKYQIVQAEIQQLQQRHAEIQNELSELKERKQSTQSQLTQAENILRDSQANMENYNSKQNALITQRQTLQDQLETLRDTIHQQRQQAQQLMIRWQTATTQLESLESSISRQQTNIAELEQQRDGLKIALDKDHDPEQIKGKLDQKLHEHAELDKEVITARQSRDEAETKLQEIEQTKARTEESARAIEHSTHQMQMEAEGFRVRATTFEEQLKETEHDINVVINELPADADVKVWDEQCTKIANKISRLGPINLAAIDEYETESERKTYLDAQHEDLTEALTTLENAIQKIDRETRTRFKETFETVNTTFKKLFPRLFGGGSAYLELIGEDVLDCGVSVMARPPGKRNSTIHLLSGGEKAMTAVALVFSIFTLNPSPFCLLDEVDAPLDDANVGRFTQMVREMSAKTQFLIITHNKVTMELAEALTGVTMHEPGVSRLVAVDVDEAVSLAEA